MLKVLHDLGMLEYRRALQDISINCRLGRQGFF